MSRLEELPSSKTAVPADASLCQFPTTTIITTTTAATTDAAIVAIS